MKARSEILGDTGKDAPERWDAVWEEDRVHVWLGVNGRSREALEHRCSEMQQIMDETKGARLLYATGRVVDFHRTDNRPRRSTSATPTALANPILKARSGLRPRARQADR